MSASERERLARTEELFAAAKALPASAREAFVRSRAGDDARLSSEVLELLALDARAAPALDRPADPWLGRTLGRWRVTTRIGAGGMGVVYVAERDDGQFRQRAALKLLRQGLDDPRHLERFRTERQILAGLAHPSIARLIDGGTSEEGLPWLVMELVDGTRLDRWCDERALSVAGRLALFGAICGAVQYAHQKLVVHRDLKPSNVLVTPEGAVKLVDFGISRVLDVPQDSAEQAQERRLTPEYTAPEVIRGASATTQSDVFSLGVLLYELLTGTRPWRDSETSMSALEQAIASTRATLPSQHALTSENAARRRTTPSRLRRTLRGDLDAIVARALAADPASRYASAAELADDVGRALSHRPVAARGGGTWYRLARWARRNRVLAAAVLAGLVALAAGASGLARATLAERRHAQATARVNGLLGELLAELDPSSSRGLERSLLAQLDTAARRIDEGLLAGDPEVELDLRVVLGRTYHLFGRGHPAAAQFARARQLAETDLPPEDARQASLLRLEGGALRLAGELPRALDLLERAVARARERVAVDAGERRLLVPALHELGLVRLAQGEARLAEVALREALERRTRLGGPEDEALAALENALGAALLATQELDLALVYVESGLARRQRLHAAPDLRLAWSEDSLGRVRLARGELDQARAAAERALALRRALFDEENAHVAQSLMLLGDVLLAAGQAQAAVAEYERALAIRRVLLAADSSLLGYTLVSLGLAEAEAGDSEQAAAHLAEGLALPSDGTPEAERRRALARARSGR